jgi:hypothetical protein
MAGRVCCVVVTARHKENHIAGFDHDQTNSRKYNTCMLVVQPSHSPREDHGLSLAGH